MDLRQVDCFLTVAKTLNYTDAANELSMSQATLSRQITAIERELNVLLFARNTRSVTLTKCGEYLYREWKQWYGDYGLITDNAKKIFAGFSGQLQIGVLEELMLPDDFKYNMSLYERKYTNCVVNYSRKTFRELSDGLTDGSVDLAITLFFAIENMTSLEYRKLEKHRRGILISNTNPLAGKKVFHPLEFRNQVFLAVDDEDSRQATDRVISLCSKYGFYPKIKLVPNLDAAMLSVEAGQGITIIHSGAISAEKKNLTFIPFSGEDVDREPMIVMAWSGYNRNPALKSFLEEFGRHK